MINSPSQNNNFKVLSDQDSIYGADFELPVDHASALTAQMSSKPLNLEVAIQQLLNGTPLPELQVLQLCQMLKQILELEPTVKHIKAPVTVAGDIHGQLFDLLQIFRIAGLPNEAQYLFLGDYVDRGFQSVEVISLLSALKVRYHDKVCLLRGNHESRHITLVYGFYDECMRKYGSPNVWRAFTDLFDFLPLCAVIDQKVFCDHGGLSPELPTLDGIRDLDRVKEVPGSGPVCDLLWSDPSEDPGWNTSPRGAGYHFGVEESKVFVHRNDLNFLCRAHQLVEEGYQWSHEGTVVTVFSAPNYCYRCGNTASVLDVGENSVTEFTKFSSAPLRANKDEIRKFPDYFF